MTLQELRNRNWSWFGCQTLLGNRDEKKVANNTIIRKRGNSFDVVLHYTPIVTYHDNGDIVLNSGGWRTNTTKQRINACTPPGIHIWQDKHVWYISTNQDYGTRTEFEDGMLIKAEEALV